MSCHPSPWSCRLCAAVRSRCEQTYRPTPQTPHGHRPPLGTTAVFLTRKNGCAYRNPAVSRQFPLAVVLSPLARYKTAVVQPFVSKLSLSGGLLSTARPVLAVQRSLVGGEIQARMFSSDMCHQVVNEPDLSVRSLSAGAFGFLSLADHLRTIVARQESTPGGGYHYHRTLWLPTGPVANPESVYIHV